MDAFNKAGPEITVVAVPQPSCIGYYCCCEPYIQIPSGPWVLYQKWYKNMGSIGPGVKCCWPFWFRVSHVVSKQILTYNAPSRNVPTADNVFVDVNLSLFFSIGDAVGDDITDAEKFVYSLGCARFDEFISCEVEEGIRGLVYSVTHDRVNDLREEFSAAMVASLKRKFRPFGVHIHNVKITDTALPRELAQQLEQTTTFRTKISEMAKKHENRLRVQADQASQELEQIVRTNMRREQDLAAQCVRYQIEHQEKTEEMVGSARVQEMGAKSRMDVLVGQAKGDLEVATAEGEREAEVIRRKMQIECEQRRVKIEERAGVLILESEGQLRAAENDAQALIAQAEAENNSTAGLEVKRKYELEWQRLEILEKLATSGRRFISGPTGQQMMREMVPSSTSMAKPSGKTYF